MPPRRSFIDPRHGPLSFCSYESGRSPASRFGTSSLSPLPRDSAPMPTQPTDIPGLRRHVLSRTMEKTTRSGAMTLGLQTGEASSHAIMDRGLETGVHFYGTA